MDWREKKKCKKLLYKSALGGLDWKKEKDKELFNKTAVGID